MRRCDRAYISAVQIGENGDRKRCAFGRISTGTELVEEDEGALICLIPEGDNICHMRRERTETLFNTLLISNVSVDFIKNGKLRVVGCRDMQTGLSEQCKQSDGLQGDRFSSGIWSGDHEHREILSDADIDRNDLFRIKQWMTALFASDAPFFVEIRFASLIVERELSTRKDEVQLRHEQDIVIDGVAVDSYLPA